MVSTTLNSDISAELTATADSDRETQMQIHKQRRLQTPVNYAAAAAAVSPWLVHTASDISILFQVCHRADLIMMLVVASELTLKINVVPYSK